MACKINNLPYDCSKEKNEDSVIYLYKEIYKYYKSKLYLDVGIEFSKEFDIVDRNVRVMKKLL